MYREWQVDKPNRRANAACRIEMPCRLGMMEWDSRLACRNGMLGWAPGVAYRKGLPAWLIEFTDGMKHSGGIAALYCRLLHVLPESACY